MTIIHRGGACQDLLYYQVLYNRYPHSLLAWFFNSRHVQQWTIPVWIYISVGNFESIAMVPFELFEKSKWNWLRWIDIQVHSYILYSRCERGQFANRNSLFTQDSPGLCLVNISILMRMHACSISSILHAILICDSNIVHLHTGYWVC